MFRSTAIDFGKSIGLGRLAADYLEGKEQLSSFYEFKPDIGSFRDLLAAKPYCDLDRKTLVKALLSQAAATKNSSEATLSNINALTGDNCYTITTGHQLCLFTGPLYFIYKILSVIRLADRLGKDFPDHRFVPVYWLAGEDHDFDE